MALNYHKAEEKERSVLLKLMKILRPNRYVFSEIGSCEVWDFLLSYDKGRYLGDIKCLSHDSKKYDCIFLEEKKAKNLIFAGFKMGIYNAPVYLSHYTDNIVNCLRLTPSLLSFYPLVWKTVGGVKKRVYLIPVTEAKTIEL